MKTKVDFDYSIGSIHSSNNYGSFEIIGESKHIKKYQYYDIRFIETGYLDTVRSDAIRSGAVKDHSYDFDFSPGSIHLSNNYGPFEIIGKSDKAKYHNIRFIKTGYTTSVQDSNIRHGNVKDPYAKVIFGVACIGNITTNGKLIEYSRWHSMISRCYNPNDSRYSTYGAVGVTVCERWLCFEYYYNDMPNMPGYDEYIKNPEYYNLDKDFTQQDQHKSTMIYSPETCRFIHRETNECYRCNTGTNNSTGYYGVKKYTKNSNTFIAIIRYKNHNRTIGVYATPEIAAGAYNYFVITRSLNNKPLNPVKTLTMEEVVNLDLRSTKYTMVRYVNNPNQHQLYPLSGAQSLIPASELTPLQVLAPALAHFTAQPQTQNSLIEMCKIVNK